MDFRETAFFRVMERLEKAIHIIVPELLKAVATAIGLGILSAALVVGFWQGSVYVFGREPVEHKAADVIESIEAIRISIDGTWHWAPEVQSKIAESWISNECPAEKYDVYLTHVGNGKIVVSCEVGKDPSKDVIFRPKYLSEENLGNGTRGLAFLYELGEVRVTPYQLLSSWVSMLFS